MDGVHDLGGMQGFGPVEREDNEPTFHATWEAAVLAMMRAGGLGRLGVPPCGPMQRWKCQASPPSTSTVR